MFWHAAVLSKQLLTHHCSSPPWSDMTLYYPNIFWLTIVTPHSLLTHNCIVLLTDWALEALSNILNQASWMNTVLIWWHHATVYCDRMQCHTRKKKDPSHTCSASSCSLGADYKLLEPLLWYIRYVCMEWISAVVSVCPYYKPFDPTVAIKNLRW